ncbi:MAG: alpha/beta hydrolase [Tatlockia sp.]|nr:alpha/beta hydrolase [Tatlockia sp.]
MLTKGDDPSGPIPLGLNVEEIPKHFKLPHLDGSGLNEFTKNYAIDIKDVINYVSEHHPQQKILVIAHSLGGHQLLSSLQHYPDLNQKIEAICNVAMTADMGMNRFWSNLPRYSAEHFYVHIFYHQIQIDCEDKIKSKVNKSQSGPEITKENNPVVNRHMNQELSVIYGDLGNFPPMMLIHAKDDQSVFFQGTVLLYEKSLSQGAVVNALFLESGGHQFIKNEGSLEIQRSVFEKISEFFQNPLKKSPIDLPHFQYEDVKSAYERFIQDNIKFLTETYPNAPMYKEKPSEKNIFAPF